MRSKHPMGPFTVIVREYRIAPIVDMRDLGAVYLSRHSSAKSAAGRLASIIAGRSKHTKRAGG